MTASAPPSELKRFVLRTLLFALPLLVGAILLLQTRLERSFAAYFTRGDSAGRAMWINSRLALETPIDIAFVGTSRTVMGIDDRAIEAGLRARGRALHVVNLGYPRNGRNMHYVVARDALERRKIRHLIVEISHKEHRRSHPMFGFRAHGDDLWGAPFRYDLEYVADLYKGLQVRLDQARHRLLGLGWPTADPTVSPYGPRDWGPHRIESNEELDRMQRHRARWGAPGTGENPSADMRPRHYIRALAALARKHGTRIHFCFIPSYGEPWARMRDEALFRELGDVWIPPRAIFDDRRNWYDTFHFNKTGRAQLAAWLAEKLATLE